MKKVYNFSDGLIKIGAYMSGVFIFITTIMVFFEIISRAVFGLPTAWATELSIYSIIGSCFLGSAYAVRTYSHITVDIIINNVSDFGKKVLAYITNALGLIFSIVFTVYGFIHVYHTFSLGVTSASLLRVPMYLPELLLPLGGVLMVAAFVMQIIDGGVHKGGEHL